MGRVPEYCAAAHAWNNVWSEASRNDVGSEQKHKHLLEWPLSKNNVTY